MENAQRRSSVCWNNRSSTCPKSCANSSFPVAMDGSADPVAVHTARTVVDRNAVETTVAVEGDLAEVDEGVDEEVVETAAMAEVVAAIAAGSVEVAVEAAEAVADMAPLADEALAEAVEARAAVDLAPRNRATALRPRSAAQTSPIRRRVVTTGKITRVDSDTGQPLFYFCHHTVTLQLLLRNLVKHLFQI